MQRVKLTAEEAQRADVFLSAGAGLTRSMVKKLADRGMVWVNGVNAKAGAQLKAGDVAEILIPDPVPVAARAEDIPIDIVYEDDEIAVVNKPQGMTVHAGAGNYEGTLVNALLYRLKNLSGVGGELRPGIVHRIDKDTSGLLVVAKTDRAHLSLQAQIAQKTAKREYLALLEGVLRADEGQIVTQMGRDKHDRLKQAVLPAGEGRRAETEYFVVERFPANTLARFSLKTGRTHQIRVHARYLGHPVVGDPLYGYKNQRFHLEGQLLHAYRLTLTHPVTGEVMTFEAPMPEYFARILTILRNEAARKGE